MRRGGLTFDLVHAKGETDDGTIGYVREHKLLLPGDLFLWVTPNCGNPQKAQRYPREWAHALHRMAAMDAEIVHSVRAPEQLADRPYLRARHDEPELVVRNLWRLYGGWYDGNPAHLKPAPEAALAKSVAEPAGGANALADAALKAHFRR